MSQQKKKRWLRKSFEQKKSQLLATRILRGKINQVQGVSSIEEVVTLCSKEFRDIETASTREDLISLYDEALGAKRSLEDKAKALVITLTIATTLCTGLYGILPNAFASLPSPILKCFVAFCAISSVGTMAIAAFKSIGIFTTNILVHTVNINASDQILELAKCTIANRWENIIRSNKLSDAFTCLRISIGTLFALFAALVIVA